MFYGSKSEHGVCASLRAGYKGCPSETNALVGNEFSRQRTSNRSRGGVFVAYHYVLVYQRNQVKALGISSR